MSWKTPKGKDGLAPKVPFCEGAFSIYLLFNFQKKHYKVLKYIME